MKKANMEKSKAAEGGAPPSQLIDERICELGDWRGETLARVRALIKAADPEAVEEWKGEGSRPGRTPESYVIANSQLTRLGDDGEISDPASLRPIKILEIGL